jgi:hypothetical protein
VRPGAPTDDIGRGGCTMFHVKHRSADGVLVPRETRGTAPVELLPREVARRPPGPVNAVYPHAARRRGGRRQRAALAERRRFTWNIGAHQPPCAGMRHGLTRRRGLGLRCVHAAARSAKGSRTRRGDAPSRPVSGRPPGLPRRRGRPCFTWNRARNGGTPDEVEQAAPPVHFDAVKCIRAGAESARGRSASTHGVRQARFHVKRAEPAGSAGNVPFT